MAGIQRADRVNTRSCPMSSCARSCTLYKPCISKDFIFPGAEKMSILFDPFFVIVIECMIGEV